MERGGRGNAVDTIISALSRRYSSRIGRWIIAHIEEICRLILIVMDPVSLADTFLIDRKLIQSRNECRLLPSVQFHLQN
jgi:hypothetical protein